jgi:ParB/RepB/Spo0J family partition protein
MSTRRTPPTTWPIADIRVADIVVPQDRMRKLRPETVDEIAESIAAQGLIEPIILRPRGAANFWLIVGRHRLEAVRKCGHDRIRAVVVDGVDADQAQLIEIDENLIRADLSPAERALHMERRKELYEKLHPETVSVRVRGGRVAAKKTTLKMSVVLSPMSLRKPARAAAQCSAM